MRLLGASELDSLRVPLDFFLRKRVSMTAKDDAVGDGRDGEGDV